MDNTLLKNKEMFNSMLKRISREGANIDALIETLESSNWYESPATTEYHDSNAGGLVRHSMKVYENLENLCKLYNKPYSANTLMIVALLHDLSKMNLYEPTVKNKKVYSDQGTKYDELGRFDWVSEKSWSAKKYEDRFMIGTSSQTTEYMVRQFIPLSREESVALINLNTHEDGNVQGNNLLALYKKYPLALLLSMADLSASYLEDVNVD